MRESGRILSIVHTELAKMIKPGISTLDIDKRCYEVIRDFGCIPSFLNYQGYPASVCVSINDEVVHGIPNKNRILKDGDIVSLDAGVIYQGYHSDAARTVAVGEIGPEWQRLMDVTKQSFFEGIKFAKEGYRVQDISAAVQTYVESHGFSVVREFVGHGVGTHLHESPEIPNFGRSGRGARLLRGMTLAIEPMVNLGGAAILQMNDGWTVKTRDGKLSAHYENTILVTDGEPEILTAPAI
jgi:methionyl aminopeptidase